MTAADRSPASQTESLSFEFDLAHPPEKVWRALTDPALLSEWLLPVVGLQLEPGPAFTFRAQPVGGWDGTVHGRLLEVDAPRTLRMGWVVGDLDTVVTFTIKPTPSGTHLSIVHAGFKPSQKQNVAGARYGWTMMGGKLIDLLARIS